MVARMATMIGDVTDIQERVGGGGYDFACASEGSELKDDGSPINLFNKKQSVPFYTVPASGRRQIVAVT